MKKYEVTITRTGSITITANSQEDALQRVVNLTNSDIDGLGNFTNWEASDAEEAEDEIINNNTDAKEIPSHAFYGQIIYYGFSGNVSDLAFFKNRKIFQKVLATAQYYGEPLATCIFETKEQYQNEMLDYWKKNISLPNIHEYQIIQSNSNSVVGLNLQKSDYLCVSRVIDSKLVGPILECTIEGLEHIKGRLNLEVDIDDIKIALDDLDFQKKPEKLRKIDLMNKKLMVNGTLFLRVLEKELSYDDIYSLEKAIKDTVVAISLFPTDYKSIIPVVIGCLEKGKVGSTIFSINLFGEIDEAQENEWISFWTIFIKEFRRLFLIQEVSSKFTYITTAPMSIDIV